MKIVNFILAIMFLAFAFLQVNDPDPILWILIYGAMAAVCIMAIFDYYIPMLMAVLVIGYVIYCVLLWPGFSVWLASVDKAMLFSDIAKMENIYIEESREFLGLVICIATLSFYGWRYRLVRNKNRETAQ